jgi:hypothetical protein
MLLSKFELFWIFLHYLPTYSLVFGEFTFTNNKLKCIIICKLNFARNYMFIFVFGIFNRRGNQIVLSIWISNAP